MKKLLMCLALLFVSLSLWAQSDDFRAFAEKFDQSEGYEVVTIGRTAIKLAALAADKESRQLMKKLDLMVTVKCDDVADEKMRGDFEKLVSNYDCLGDYKVDDNLAMLYMNSDNTGFALYFRAPEEQYIILLAGRDLVAEEILTTEIKESDDGRKE